VKAVQGGNGVRPTGSAAKLQPEYLLNEDGPQ
jgi:hypothetical protein